MKRYLTTGIIVLTIAFLTSGCLGPLRQWNNAVKKEATAEQKIDAKKEETAEKARTFIHGTGSALKLDPSPSKYSDVALSLNQRAELTLGQPSYQDSLIIDKIVAGLLSTNEQIKTDAKRALEIKDSEVVSLQKQLRDLGVKLETIQEEKKELGLKNSQLANTWAKITRWFWITVWVIGIGIALALLSQLLSVLLPPPYNGIFAVIGLILGGIGKLIFKIVPSSKKYSGVVDEKEFGLSEKTLKALVSSIQEIRNKEVKPEDLINTQPVKISNIIDSILKDKTDDITRPKITAIKQALGNI